MARERLMTLTRRAALKTTAAVAAPLVVPSHVLGKESPSNTLRIGSIGVGRKGRWDMQAALHRGLGGDAPARIVATCDVDAGRAAHAKRQAESTYTDQLGKGKVPEIATFGDYRELLERDDIDGVTISTPDHWHALPAIYAAENGKDIYLQKPLTYTVAEGRALVEAAQANGIVFQTGSQQRSSVYFRKGCELARNGYLGKLKRIEVKLPKDSGRADPTPMDVPEALDYPMWMGPTAEAPYTEDRVHPQKGYGRPGWLQIQRYSRGMITGWGAHMNDIAQWAHGTDRDGGPAWIKATAEFPDRGLFDVHTTFHAEGAYPDGVELIQQTGPAGVKVIGEDGWVHMRRGKIDAEPKSVLRQKLGEDDERLYRSENHMLNFLRCMRSRNETVAPVEVGHRSNTICLITHIAMKLGRKLHWDAENERFKNDEEANAMLSYEHREPWTL